MEDLLTLHQLQWFIDIYRQILSVECFHDGKQTRGQSFSNLKKTTNNVSIIDPLTPLFTFTRFAVDTQISNLFYSAQTLYSP